MKARIVKGALLLCLVAGLICELVFFISNKTIGDSLLLTILAAATYAAEFLILCYVSVRLTRREADSSAEVALSMIRLGMAVLAFMTGPGHSDGGSFQAFYSDWPFANVMIWMSLGVAMVLFEYLCMFSYMEKQMMRRHFE